jgi:hypothetical protein
MSKEEEEEVDIDLEDPDVEKAAIKIQAGFKGFKARKEVKEEQVRNVLIMLYYPIWITSVCQIMCVNIY